MSRRCALLLFVIALAAHAAAGAPVRNPGFYFQGNLLPQGEFENPNANTGRAEGFDIPNNQTVTPPMRALAPLADATLPPGVHLNWDQTSIQPLNAKWAQLSLDGIWRFAPAAGGPPPQAGWGYIKVPGDWQD